MFNLDQAIANWRSRFLAAGIRTPALLDELESHLREEVDRLVRSGASAEEAFRAAAGRLGEAGALQPEFAKVGCGRFVIHGDAPFALRILALWFVLAGLSGLSFLPPLWLAGSAGAIHAAVCLSLCGLQVMMGVGLWQRRNFWRHGALAWAALYLVAGLAFLRPFGGVAGHLVFAGFEPPADLAQRAAALSHWQLALVFTRFADFRHVTDFLNPFLLIWGSYVLTRPQIRNLFGAGAVQKAAS